MPLKLVIPLPLFLHASKEVARAFGRDMEIAYMINKRIAAYSDAQWDGALT